MHMEMEQEISSLTLDERSAVSPSAQRGGTRNFPFKLDVTDRQFPLMHMEME
jgi:hypothetical protein